MPRARRAAVLVAASAVFALAACGAVGGPAQPTEIATWSEPAGIARELVYVTEIDGFDLATQSVGVMGDDGMSAMYVNADGGSVGTVLLATRRDADPSVTPCAELPDSAEADLRCSVERGAVHVVLDGEGVDPATLRAAAEAVRVPKADELGQLFADLPTMAGTPLERGDLPPAGDGAPVDSPGPGG